MNEQQAIRALCTATTFADKEACRDAIFRMLCDEKGAGRLMVLQRALVYSPLLIQLRIVLQTHVSVELIRDEVAYLLARCLPVKSAGRSCT